MNYNELSQIWKESSEVNAAVNINQKLVTELSVQTVKQKISEIRLESILEIVASGLWNLFLVYFLVNHLTQAPFVIPAVILLGISIYSILFEARKLTLYYSINNSDSILQTQQKLAKLKYLEKIDTNSLIVFIPLFFVPFIIVAAKGFLGLSVYELGFSLREMIAAAIGSLVVAGIIIVLLKMYPNKQLSEASKFMDELSDIENENAE